MGQQLSLAARPRTLDQLVGQDKMVRAIRGHMASGRTVKAWLFAGPKGTGKTTTAKILSLSYQCEHQTVFGTPCKACRLNKAAFPIFERNSSSMTGIKEMRQLLDDAEYGIMGLGSYKVYILDEIHRVSEQAQDALLKGLEETPDTAVFILCSTEPDSILETLRSRCIYYELRDLDSDTVGVLVARLLKFGKSKLPVDRLTDALVEANVFSPRLVAQAVEKYIASEDPDSAAQVGGVTSVDVEAIGTAVVRGEWGIVAELLKLAQAGDLKSIRLSMISYLRVILLNSPEVSDAAQAVSKGLHTLCSQTNAEDLVMAAKMAAALYDVCAFFSTKYSNR